MSALCASSSSLAALDVLQDVFCGYQPRDFDVRLWDGTVWPAQSSRRFTLVIQHPCTLRRMLFRPNLLSLGRAYVRDELDLEGDIHAAFKLGCHLLALSLPWRRRLRLACRVLCLPWHARSRHQDGRLRLGGRRGSRSRTQVATKYHYDLPPEFFAYWLDQQMVYSCAYFKSKEDSLDTAQRQKLDYVCRKLDLARGDRLMDWGCGWGSLVIHAARHYGVDATGLTLSPKQAKHANERIEREGLAGRCRVEVRDYRDCPESEPYDKLVSVGMVEHVRESALRDYYAKALRVLKPGGVFLNHGIARSGTRRLRGAQTFIDRYVFPDSRLSTLNATLTRAEVIGFEVRDVENLREHYALTLRRWVDNLESRRSEIERLVGESTYRRFRVYLAGSAYCFDVGRLGVYQSLLLKPTGRPAGLAPTRDRWYAEAVARRVPAARATVASDPDSNRNAVMAKR